MSTVDKSKKPTAKGRFVPSRYKQAAEKVATTRDITTRDVTTRQTNLHITTSSSQLNIPDITNFSIQNSDGNSFLKTRCTSTPALNKYTEMPSINASAISADDQTFCRPKMKNNFISCKKNLKLKKVPEKEAFHRGPLIVPQLERKVSDLSHDEAREEELDIVYAQYLQALYLESEAKKSLDLRSKTAFETIHRVWSLIQILMGKDKDYDKELDDISYMINLHRHLCEHEQMLVPVLEIFPLLLSQYETIAEVVDSVRHKLAVNGVAPLDSIMEEEIISSLNTFKTSLEEFLNTLPEEKCLSQAANSLALFASQGDNITQEIIRCNDSLCKADDILITETSLAMNELS